MRGQQARSFPLHEHLRDGSLDDAGQALALLARQRCRDGEADARPRFDELLHSQPARASDPHALREHLLQKALIAHNIERRCIVGRMVQRLRGHGCGTRRGTQLNVDDRRGGERGS